jgi:hypothetical protein
MEVPVERGRCQVLKVKVDDPDSWQGRPLHNATAREARDPGLAAGTVG